MTDFNVIENAIAESLQEYINDGETNAELLKYSVVRANRNDKETDGSCVDYVISTMMAENKTGWSLNSGGIYSKPITQRWKFVTHSADCTEGMTMAAKVYEFFEIAGRTQLSDNDIVVKSVGSVLNADEETNGVFDYRNQIDVEFGMIYEVQEVQEENETIEQVEINGGE